MEINDTAKATINEEILKLSRHVEAQLKIFITKVIPGLFFCKNH